MESARPQQTVTARGSGLVACTRCSRVWPADRDICGRCHAPLQSRDPTALSRVWAWMAVGIICYIPANLYPMLLTQTLLSTSKSTIIGGAIELIHHGAVGIAIIIIVASVLIPMGKFVAIAYLALSLKHQVKLSAAARHRLYEYVEFIGRWSMIDVFVVAILSSLVQLSAVAAINPGPAAITFALSVIFTMLSAQSFDPRSIWDAEEEDTE
ncbi:paraquat-inducible protein A [Oceaniglobus roseus]|uniref:paraquat-inducible protein A n=1 Tax=Oceaniglobus roseus TaxID=1737570 RepID=UPI000C7E8C54|nr:paraquat-inducible protein A [Kandeliimicrobium roseum]